MAWKIRFYSGLNQGTEVPLAQGRVVIGSDPLQADLVIVDPGIAAIHLVLDVDEQEVRLLEWAEGNPPAQGGEPLNGGSALQPLAAQTCGPLLWAYCAQGQSFSKELVLLGLPREAETRGAQFTWGRRILTIGSLLLLFAVIALLGEPWLRPKNTVASEAPVVALHNFLLEKRLVHVDVGAPQEDGVVPITGYVDDNRTRQMLQSYLEHNGLPFRLDIRNMEEICKDADFILRKFGYQYVQVTSAERPGWIQLSGEHIQEDERWAQLEQLLKSDVSGLLGVESQVRVTGAAFKRLQQLLNDFGFGAEVVLHDEGDFIALSGKLNEVQLKKFSTLQQQFIKEFGDRPTLKWGANEAPVNGPPLDLIIRSVSIGRVPYLILGDNRKYPINALMPGGIRVVDIQTDSVVVRRGGQQFTIYLGDGARP